MVTQQIGEKVPLHTQSGRLASWGADKDLPSSCAAPAGGYLAHSLAIMTDAAHLLTDFASMLISLFSLWMSSRPATKTMNFGWQRAGERPWFRWGGIGRGVG